MADAKKIPVKLEKVLVAKSTDPKLNKPASDALTAAVKAAVDKSKLLELLHATPIPDERRRAIETYIESDFGR